MDEEIGIGGKPGFWDLVFVCSKKMKFGLKWVHMAQYELILRLDGALWLRIIFKPLLTPKRAIKIKNDPKNLKTASHKQCLCLALAHPRAHPRGPRPIRGAQVGGPTLGPSGWAHVGPKWVGPRGAQVGGPKPKIWDPKNKKK